MAILTARCSTIFIATGEAMRVYRALEEIPPPLRHKLQESTRGLNSATILIADKRGREELIRALEAQSRETQRHAEAVAVKVPAEPQSRPKRLSLRSIRIWLELLLAVVIGSRSGFLSKFGLKVLKRARR